MKELIKKLTLQIQILKIQLEILLLQKKATVPNLLNPRYIIVHHGAGNYNFKEVNESHKYRWGFISSLGFYAGYQYFIETDGKVYQARKDNEEGAHTVSDVEHYYNRNSIGICLQGNMEIDYPTQDQQASLKSLIDKKKEEYQISNERVLGHCELQATLCPGKNLWKWLVQNYPSFGKVGE